MPAILRYYQGPGDLDLQRNFWIEATRTLPWCWKATTSTQQFARAHHFDPRSRCFAFDGPRLAGYMSFTGEGRFVSLGYPWVLPGYEGELQQELYDAVYGFAAGPDYGGRFFTQRFRRQWTRQIDFFAMHGFAEQRSEPIYALDLSSPEQLVYSGPYRVEIQPGFRWEAYEQLAAKRMPADQLGTLKAFIRTVDFDFAVSAFRRDALAAYLGFALRPDTGLTELIAVTFEEGAGDAIVPSLAAAEDYLRLRNGLFLATKPIPGVDTDAILIDNGFRKVSEDVFLSKSI